jgi:hypothetical protein
VGFPARCPGALPLCRGPVGRAGLEAPCGGWSFVVPRLHARRCAVVVNPAAGTGGLTSFLSSGVAWGG